MAGTRKLKQLPAQSMIRLACGAACALLLSMQAEVCLAQTDMPVELSWRLPENCPKQTEVQEQIRTLVGTLGETQPAIPLRVRGVIEPINERYRLTLLIEKESGSRHTRDRIRRLPEPWKGSGSRARPFSAQGSKLGRELTESDISGKPEPPPKPPDAPKPKPPETIRLPAAAARERQWRVLVRGPEVAADFGLCLTRTLG